MYTLRAPFYSYKRIPEILALSFSLSLSFLIAKITSHAFLPILLKFRTSFSKIRKELLVDEIDPKR